MTDQSTFSLEEARSFVLENRFGLPKEVMHPEYLLPFEMVRCGDDREHRQGSDLPPVALLGAGLGVLISVFTGFHKLEKTLGRKLNLNLHLVTRELEELFGLPSFHTDLEAGSSGHALACAGCGHCAGAFRRDGMSDEAKAFLKEDYIPSLITRGVKPAVYDGKHNAAGVIIVKPFDIGIANGSPTGDGPRVYVINQGWHKRLIRRIAHQLYFKITHIATPDVTLVQLADSILWDSAKAQLSHTVEALAEKLPKYIVKYDATGKITVGKMGPRDHVEQ